MHLQSIHPCQQKNLNKLTNCDLLKISKIFAFIVKIEWNKILDNSKPNNFQTEEFSFSISLCVNTCLVLRIEFSGEHVGQNDNYDVDKTITIMNQINVLIKSLWMHLGYLKRTVELPQDIMFLLACLKISTTYIAPFKCFMHECISIYIYCQSYIT